MNFPNSEYTQIVKIDPSLNINKKQSLKYYYNHFNKNLVKIFKDLKKQSNNYEVGQLEDFFT